MSEQNRLTRLKAWWGDLAGRGRDLLERLEYVGEGIRDRLDDSRDPYEIASWAKQAFQDGPPDDDGGAGEPSCPTAKASAATCESERARS